MRLEDTTNIELTASNFCFDHKFFNFTKSTKNAR